MELPTASASMNFNERTGFRNHCTECRNSLCRINGKSCHFMDGEEKNARTK